VRCGLGIDTGGTYTDAVVFDFDENKVISVAKSITVKENLTEGINAVIEKLPREVLSKVKLVSLSTTLATNACVEGKGTRAKLVMIGCDEEIILKYGKEYGLPETKDIIFLNGGHNSIGEIKSEPDWNFLKVKVDECVGKTDAFAIVELWGIRNAEYEKKAKEMIFTWTGMQVSCGHELTNEINSLKRAVSALLNSQLIYIINDFFTAAKNSLKQNGIDAPLVIVRGDGSLMSEEFARLKPIETILCGPAASVAGGICLTGEKNCIIVDMGGTTSDISIVKDGLPILTSEGAKIGKWRTGIKSIQINTMGLGGDSLIRHNNENTLDIGPVRVAPLAWTASCWPDVLKKIKAIYENGKRHTISLCEFFYFVRDISQETFYSSREKEISAALRGGPLSLIELAETVGNSIYDINVKRLEQFGVIMRCGLTPTDIMHLTGDFTGWNAEASWLGAKIMAHQINTNLEGLIEMVNEKVKESLYCDIVKMGLEDANEKLFTGGISAQFNDLLKISYKNKRDVIKNNNNDNENNSKNNNYNNKNNDNIDSNDNSNNIYNSNNDNNNNNNNNENSMMCGFPTSATLVGIGAPIHIFLPDIARMLDTTCIIPENASVANAIGAITGNVMVEESVIIRPQYSIAGITGYIGFSSIGNKNFELHKDAVAWAESTVSEVARKSAMDRGADRVELSVKVNNYETEIASEYKEDTDDSMQKSNLSSGEFSKYKTETKIIKEGKTTTAARNKTEGDTPTVARNKTEVETPTADGIDKEGENDTRRQKGNKLFLETVVTGRAVGKISMNVQIH